LIYILINHNHNQYCKEERLEDPYDKALIV